MPTAMVKDPIERLRSRKKEPFRWRFYNAVNKKLSPNPFLAKSQASHQRSVNQLSPAQAISLPPERPNEIPRRIISIAKEMHVLQSRCTHF